MAGSIAKLSSVLNLDATGWMKELDLAGARMQQFGDKIHKDFQGTRDKIAEMKWKLVPSNIQQQVKLDLAAESQQKQYSQAMAAERKKQLGITPQMEQRKAQADLAIAGVQGAGGKVGRVANFATNVAAGAATGGHVGAAVAAAGSIAQDKSLLIDIAAMSNPVTAVMYSAATGVIEFGKVMKGLGDSMASFVGKYNPAAAERWTKVGDDFTAVLGARMAPALELFTAAFRGIADFIHTALPDPGTIQAALKPFRDMGPAFSYVAAMAAPVVKFVLTDFVVFFRKIGEVMKWVFDGFSSLGSWLTDFANAIGRTVEAISDGIDELYDIPLVGKFLPGSKRNLTFTPYENPMKPDPLKSSVGMSVGSAGIMTDVTQLGMENLKAAYGAVNPQEMMVNEQKTANGYLARMAAAIAGGAARTAIDGYGS